jgi:phage terminase large subunit GpA-like protein
MAKFSKTRSARRAPAVKSPALGSRIWADTADAWAVPPAPETERWVPENIRVPDELITDNDSFDLDSYPHVLEVLRAADDPSVREIYLRWSTRNAKTFTAMSILISLVAETGRPAMLASSNEDRIDDVISSELYPMLEACAPTRPMLLPYHRRSSKKGVVIGKGRIRRCYSGSASTMAGFQAVYGLANEVGLWAKNMLQRFRQRARLFPFDSVLIFEGKPEVEGECAISDLVDKETTQRRFRLVPCPHCGHYQRLRWGSRTDDSPGIKWDHGRGKHSDPKLARNSAYYQCEAGCRIENSDRFDMMRAGVWVPEGCTVTKRGKVKGEPEVDSANVAFDGLSALYSLKISGWGTLVSEYLDAKNDPDTYREFVTGTLAEQWRTKPVESEPSVVAARLKTDEPSRRVPAWGKFLTRAFDVQNQPTGLEFPWGVCAWGDAGRGALVDYGVAYGWEELRQLSATQSYPHADGGVSLSPTWSGVDAGDGNVSEEVYAIASALDRTLPIKGMPHKMQDAYRFGELGSKQKSRYSPRQRVIYGATMLLGVNSDRSQDWIQKHLDGVLSRDAPQRFSLSFDAALDEHLIAELVNEYSEEYIDTRGFRRRRWNRRDPSRPNDMRDVLRYCWCLAMFVTDNGKHWNSLPDRDTRTRPAAQKKTAGPSILTGGGREWR